MKRRKKNTSLRKGIEIMLELSQNNKDNKKKANFMAKWIYKYFRERKSYV
jgi:hypothetical protein